MSKLKIYKASAGSGKTYTLTKEYLFLLFNNPTNYAHTLAVTFTNKATAEMKSRILEKLYEISTKKSNDYVDDLMCEFDISEAQVRQRSKVLLSYLLHDFSNFSVSTIDSFFQKIIRSFAREAGLESGFKIELNGPKILQKAIDHLLLKIDLPENIYLKNWLIQFAEQKLNQGKNWNLSNDLNKLGTEIFNELFQIESREILLTISNKDWMQNYLKNIQEIIISFEDRLKAIGDEGLKAILKSGLSYDDFTGKSRTPVKYFEKLKAVDNLEPGATLLKIIDEPEKWGRKDNADNTNRQIAELFPLLNKLIKQALVIVEQDLEIYSTAKVISQNYFALGIIADIANEVQNICREENMFLISDSSHFLNKIIDQNDTPFIYEKIGSRYNNFMIDEFQDTSKLQWLNFKPLVENSLSNGETSLIVGDVKQSIYRWRNSDWNLLDHQISLDFINHGNDEKTLDTNWRSFSNIIKYNNTVFLAAAKYIQADLNNSLVQSIKNPEKQDLYKNKILNAYSDIIQKIPISKPDDKGYILSKFFTSTKEASYDEQMLQELVTKIEELLSKGYSYSDICILVRKKGEGEIIANALLSGNYSQNSNIIPVVSNESLFLSSSAAINFIMAQVMFLQNSGNAILKAEMVLNKQLLTNSVNDRHLEIGNYFSDNLFDSYLDSDIAWIEELLTKKQKPLLELIELLANQLPEKVKEEQGVFIQSFINCTNQFIKDNYPDLSAFIEWWKDKGKSEAIAVPDDQDAIKIMTIHKSKGLEFKTVIIPYCNWKLDAEITSNIIWCRPQMAPFDDIKLLPVTYNKKLEKTIFKEEYFDEKLYQYVDSINLLYVAFTRSCETLITYGPSPSKNNKGLKTVSDLLHYTYTSNTLEYSIRKHINLSEGWQEEDNKFEFGEIPVCNIDEQTTEAVTGEILKPFSNNILNNDFIAIKTEGNEFFSKDVKKSRINFGKIMHEVFENIHSENDIDNALNKLMFEGKIATDEKNNLGKKIRELINQKETKEWYMPSNMVRTENTIISPSGTYRPDRVVNLDNEIHVIDYKFGEKEDLKYEHQVIQYIRQIKLMEKKQIRGFIWYVTLEKITEVTPAAIQGNLF